ncbi:MAG: nitroreductase family protein [Bacteroidales bacterium]|nr:nitroreductase family protein [Bacteroidales bacterium]
MSAFLDLAKRRFSVRSYRPDPLRKEDLDYILEAGRVAPSAANYQPWFFVVVENGHQRARLAEAYPRDWFAVAPVMLVICIDHDCTWKRGDGKDHGDMDAAIAADHMTLAAADIGLGTCWICNFNREMVSHILRLPESIEPVIILSLGAPDGEGDPSRHDTKRKPAAEILRRDDFNTSFQFS